MASFWIGVGTVSPCPAMSSTMVGARPSSKNGSPAKPTSSVDTDGASPSVPDGCCDGDRDGDRDGVSSMLMTLLPGPSP